MVLLAPAGSVRPYFNVLPTIAKPLYWLLLLYENKVLTFVKGAMVHHTWYIALTISSEDA